MGRRSGQTTQKGDWLARLRSRFGGASRDDGRYPLYVACQECNEPEVEVWDCDEETRCHACGALIVCEDEPDLQAP